jgi:hypothetical protein
MRCPAIRLLKVSGSTFVMRPGLAGKNADVMVRPSTEGRRMRTTVSTSGSSGIAFF